MAPLGLASTAIIELLRVAVIQLDAEEIWGHNLWKWYSSALGAYLTENLIVTQMPSSSTIHQAQIGSQAMANNVALYYRIPDESAVKPDDWDEDAPMMIDDEEAEKPEGWLDDEPAEIADPGMLQSMTRIPWLLATVQAERDKFSHSH